MPYEIVRTFEARVAEYAGSKYGIAVESGTAAIFLSLMYAKFRVGSLPEIEIPRFTYPSVACSIIHAGAKIKFTDEPWAGVYQLKPTVVFDGALRFRRGMFEYGLHCLSFHAKKHLAIGRGGMILTNDPQANVWLRRARFDGRNEVDLDKDSFEMLGWNMYMTPDQAARGLMAFNIIKNRKDDGPEDLSFEAQGYPDLSKYEVYSR